ncbi:HPP family protein [Pseudomonadota bacterium]
MHSLRCMHPPGGATAITAVIGGDCSRQKPLFMSPCAAWPGGVIGEVQRK